jgi:hypothetical protein
VEVKRRHHPHTLRALPPPPPPQVRCPWPLVQPSLLAQGCWFVKLRIYKIILIRPGARNVQGVPEKSYKKGGQ